MLGMMVHCLLSQHLGGGVSGQTGFIYRDQVTKTKQKKIRQKQTKQNPKHCVVRCFLCICYGSYVAITEHLVGAGSFLPLGTWDSPLGHHRPVILYIHLVCSLVRF